MVGVSGVGKTTVAHALVERTGWVFQEGDDLHPEASRAKMAAGTPLTDDDRWPWLRRIAARAVAGPCAVPLPPNGPSVGSGADW